MVIPENIHTNHIKKTEQAVFRNIHVYTYMNVRAINGKRRLRIQKLVRREIWKGLDRVERREKWCTYVMTSKIKEDIYFISPKGITFGANFETQYTDNPLTGTHL